MALSDDERRMWVALVRSMACINRRLAHDMENEHQIPVAWYDVLVHLYHGPAEGMMMNVLATQVIMSTSGLTRLIDRMIAAGLVRRELCAEDRRIVYAVLTDTGRACIEAMLPRHQQRIRDYLLQHLAPDEIVTIRDAFERVLGRLDGGER